MTTPNKNLQPAIARIWRWRTSSDHADEYAAYNYEVGFKPLLEMALGAEMFRKDVVESSQVGDQYEKERSWN